MCIRDSLNAYTANMSNKDKANFLFAARIKSGGQLISSKNGGSDYDDKLINSINSLYGKDWQTAVITLSDKTLQNVDNIINGGEYEGYSKLGIRRECFYSYKLDNGKWRADGGRSSGSSVRCT